MAWPFSPSSGKTLTAVGPYVDMLIILVSSAHAISAGSSLEYGHDRGGNIFAWCGGSGVVWQDGPRDAMLRLPSTVTELRQFVLYIMKDLRLVTSWSHIAVWRTISRVSLNQV